MKLLLKEGALQFENEKEFLSAIKIAHDMLNFVSDHTNASAPEAPAQPMNTQAVQATQATQPQAVPQAYATQPQATQPQATQATQPQATQPQAQTQAQTTQPQATQPQPQAQAPQQAAQTADAPGLPTATPQYTVADLQRAARGVIDNGGQQALNNLLGEFGVQGISQLNPQQMGAFATRLRELGGAI